MTSSSLKSGANAFAKARISFWSTSPCSRAWAERRQSPTQCFLKRQNDVTVFNTNFLSAA